MVNPKHGEIYINTAFEIVYRSRFYHSIIRILEVKGDTVVARSVSDNAFGSFSCGNYPNEPFEIKWEDFVKGRFRPYKTGDLAKLKRHRIANKVLYGRN